MSHFHDKRSDDMREDNSRNSGRYPTDSLRQRSRSRDEVAHVRRDRSRSPQRRRRYRSRSREDRDRRTSDHRTSDVAPGSRRDNRQRTKHGDDVEYNSQQPRRRGSHSDRFATDAWPNTEDITLSKVPLKRSGRPLPSHHDEFTKDDVATDTRTPPPDKQKPNFATTGRLAAASNTVQASGGKSIILKYQEPPEARKPASRDAWRVYVFKGSDIVDTIELAEQSCWLFGREAAVADFFAEHPSLSKQHAVIQFRYIEQRNEYGDRKGKVRPYIIDLESSNGTKVNEEQIPAGRYIELRDKDVLMFGHSTREYVLQLPPAG